MLRILIYIALIAAVIAGAVHLADEPGQVTVLWQGWRIDTSVAVLVIAVIVLTAIVYTLLRGWSAARRAVQNFSARRYRRRVHDGLQSMGDVMAALHNGDAALAARHLKTAKRALGDHSTLDMLAGQVARAEGNREKEAALARALLDRKETRLSGLRELATIAMEAGEVDKALGYVREALSRKPRPAWAVRMQAALMMRTQDWAGALAAVSGSNAKGVFTAAETADLRADILLARARSELADSQPDLAVKSATLALETAPARAEAGALLVRALVAADKARKAQKTFAQLWGSHPSRDLLATADLLIPPPSDPLARVSALEKLLASGKDHPLTRLTLAEACAKAKLWGQMETHATALAEDDAAPAAERGAACRLMARLAREDRHDDRLALTWLDKAVKLLSEEV